MQKKYVIPLLCLILITAAVSGIRVFAGRNKPVPAAKADSLQVQTVEQERMAAMYFRVLTWLAEIAPQGPEPAKVLPESPRAPLSAKPLHPPASQGKVELCSLAAGHRPIPKCHTRGSRFVPPVPPSRVGPTS